MYTIAQIEQALATIHNQADDSPPAQARMQAITDVYLNAVTAGIDVIVKESLTEQEIELIDHFLQ